MFVFVCACIWSSETVCCACTCATLNDFYRQNCYAPPNDVETLSMCMYSTHTHQTVITGSTDGIGKEYALQLAERGFNIVLISRSKTRLVQVASEIGK